VKEAKRHEAEDRKRKDLVDARNTADQITYQTEKMLRDLGDQVPAEDRERVEQTTKDLKQAQQGSDAERIRSLIEQLQQASQAIGQHVYAKQAAAQQPGPGPGTGSQAGVPDSDDDVVEGDFREV
jgi:molecular chaperone DnaK